MTKRKHASEINHICNSWQAKMHNLHMFSLLLPVLLLSQYLRQCPVYEIIKLETLRGCIVPGNVSPSTVQTINGFEPESPPQSCRLRAPPPNRHHMLPLTGDSQSSASLGIETPGADKVTGLSQTWGVSGILMSEVCTLALFEQPGLVRGVCLWQGDWN